jgi:erythromycin esterase-like protein
VLTNLRKQIKEFAKYAEECAREAETAPNAVRDHYRKLEKHYLILAQHYLLTLEEAERSYKWANQRTGHAQASSVPESWTLGVPLLPAALVC